MARNKTWLLLLVGGILLALWFWLKLFFFEKLEYVSDIFPFLQMSRSFLAGAPLLYENFFGGYGAIHNSWLMLCFAPLTAWLDAYGLFVVLLLAWLLVLLRVMRLPWKSPSDAWFWLLFFLFGPITFWIWDDFGFGFHIEQLYLPFSILYMASLWEGRQTRWGWAFILCLLREDGPVMLCSLQLGYLWLSFSGTFPWRASLRCIGFWLCLFGLEMLWLRLMAGPESRTQQTLQLVGVMLQDESFRTPLLLDLWYWLLLCASGGVACLYASSKRLVWVFLLTSLPLLVTHIVSMAAYVKFAVYGFGFFGPTWVVRFAMIWGLLASLLLVELLRIGTAPRETVRIVLFVLVGSLAQYIALQTTREYPLLVRLASTQAEGALAADVYSPEEQRFLHCLSNALPEQTPILLPYGMQAWFDQHEIVFPLRVELAHHAPTAFVCDLEKRHLVDTSCVSWRQEAHVSSWPEVQLGAIVFRSQPTLQRAAQQCAMKK